MFRMKPIFKRSTQQIVELERRVEVWKGRAQRVAGAYRQLEKEYDRVVQDNRLLAEKLVDVASRPPTIIPAEKVDVGAILEGVRRIVQPDVIVRGGDTHEQLVNWADQGLDNNGGVGEFSDKDVRRTTGETPSIPDYVLDIERLTEQQATENGSRGGWYNPSKPQA